MTTTESAEKRDTEESDEKRDTKTVWARVTPAQHAKLKEISGRYGGITGLVRKAIAHFLKTTEQGDLLEGLDNQAPIIAKLEREIRDVRKILDPEGTMAGFSVLELTTGRMSANQSMAKAQATPDDQERCVDFVKRLGMMLEIPDDWSMESRCIELENRVRTLQYKAKRWVELQTRKASPKNAIQNAAVNCPNVWMALLGLLKKHGFPRSNPNTGTVMDWIEQQLIKLKSYESEPTITIEQVNNALGIENTPAPCRTADDAISQLERIGESKYHERLIAVEGFMVTFNTLTRLSIPDALGQMAETLRATHNNRGFLGEGLAGWLKDLADAYRKLEETSCPTP